MDRGIYSIGHSNHPIERFLDLLRLHGIEALADVRSTPYSRRHPQYSKDNLERSLNEAGIRYVFLGRELGARSRNPDALVDGRVSYERLAQTGLFQAGLDRLEAGLRKFSVAMMCAEKEPLHCHRTILVASQLRARNVNVRHILADGTLESHEAALDRLAANLALDEDLFLDRETIHDMACREQARKMTQGD